MSLALSTVIFAIGLKLLLDTMEHIPNLVTSKSLKDYQFDYIIIGGGTAGMTFFENSSVCFVLFKNCFQDLHKLLLLYFLF
jgi:hypothetical protein